VSGLRLKELRKAIKCLVRLAGFRYEIYIQQECLNTRPRYSVKGVDDTFKMPGKVIVVLNIKSTCVFGELLQKKFYTRCDQ
jgi:hypothetical protein